MSKITTKVKFTITWRCLLVGVLVARHGSFVTTVYIGLPFVMIEVDRRSRN